MTTRPCHHAAGQGDDRIHDRGDEHQACPGKAHNHGDVRHDRLCDVGQIAIHPAGLEHHDADDRVDHAGLEQHEARIAGQQRRCAGSDDQKEAQPLHGVDRFSADELDGDLCEAERHAEADREDRVVRQEKQNEKDNRRRQVEEQQLGRVEEIFHWPVNSVPLRHGSTITMDSRAAGQLNREPMAISPLCCARTSRALCSCVGDNGNNGERSAPSKCAVAPPAGVELNTVILRRWETIATDRATESRLPR